MLQLAVLILALSGGLVFGFDGSIQYDNNANIIRITSRFKNAEIARDKSGRVKITMAGLANTLGAGLPILPYQPLRILLPYGYEMDKLIFETEGHNQIRGDIARGLGQLPISWIRLNHKARKVTPPDFSGLQYPKNQVEYSIQKLHGASIALINLFPITYNRSGILDLTARIAASAVLKRSSRKQFALRNHQAQEIKTLVDNPENLEGWPLINTRSYDYLVITTQNLMSYSGPNGWSQFQTLLSQKGLTSQVVDVETAIAAATGSDRAEKLRNYLKSEYQDHGLRYVLFAGPAANGNASDLPSRSLWSKVRAYMGYWFDLERNIASDHYFASLDGSFNSNNNSKWGEPTDGDNDADVDFLPELTVGRVVIMTTEQLQNFVSKTTVATTQTLPRSMLLAGEELFAEMNLYGDEYMDQLIGTCTDHNFETSGYTSAWTETKLYDRTKAWTGTEALTALNGTAFSMINHLGHSNENYNMKLRSSSIPKLTNVMPFFYYTQGCLAASFTVGSFVDKLVSSTNAAFAAVGNSSYGLAPEDPAPTSTKTPGASQMLHRQFIHHLLANTETSFAQAHQLSKIAFVNLAAAQEVRWVTWTAIFFGDPSLALR